MWSPTSIRSWSPRRQLLALLAATAVAAGATVALDTDWTAKPQR